MNGEGGLKEHNATVSLVGIGSTPHPRQLIQPEYVHLLVLPLSLSALCVAGRRLPIPANDRGGWSTIRRREGAWLSLLFVIICVFVPICCTCSSLLVSYVLIRKDARLMLWRFDSVVGVAL